MRDCVAMERLRREAVGGLSSDVSPNVPDRRPVVFFREDSVKSEADPSSSFLKIKLGIPYFFTGTVSRSKRKS